MLIMIRRSKTIQFQECTALCAAFWTSKHFAQMPAEPNSLAFLILTSNSFSLLDYPAYKKMLRYFGGKAILDPSLRGGGATFLSMSGASLEEIKTRGIGQATQFMLILRKTSLLG